MFNGSIVALITPFTDNEIDEKALTRLIHFHLDNGTDGIVPVGTTGEASTLSNREHKRVVDIVVKEVGRQVPVIAGAGSNNTAEAISYSRHAAESGADAALHVMGYYNRPGQEGIYQHFNVLDAAAEVPIIVYNVPPRTIIDIQPETMARLAGLSHIVGVKDATCDLSRPLRERALIEGSFCFLSGEDPTAVAYNAHGGQGCISVTANVAPTLCAAMQQACAEGRFDRALEIQMQLLPLHRALFLEPSPAGVKYACSLLGLCEADCRLPIVSIADSTKRVIESAMQSISLI
ncbi:4-hydroxy-tetrahydrodipicolinate synthase [Chromatiales bacterium (ex Bugula neritina AB1)]|nr:4-hydroxy-tetrahydrodipicolinate synthase [Chromatiales bacterium (ex Bugula neritina AB1)]